MTKHDALHCMELSGLAYQFKQPQDPSTKLTVINHTCTGVQCYLRRVGDRIFITFRGSNSQKDWKTNLTFWKKCVPYGNYQSKIRVHTGFLDVYKNPNVRGEIHRQMVDGLHSVQVTGHSQGAALAVLCAVDLQYSFPNMDYEVFLYGCPRVGNRAFQQSYNKRIFKTLRFENGNDIVTKIPFALWGYRHVGIRIPIGAPRIFGLVSFEAHRPQNYYAKLYQKFSP